MSAFVVSDAHITYLVRAAVAYGAWYGEGPVDAPSAETVGAALLAENIASVAYRYEGRVEAVEPFALTRAGRPVEPVQLLKALTCYEYQSCEHPGWETSAAREFCDHLRAIAITHLPGYEAADWEITA